MSVNVYTFIYIHVYYACMYAYIVLSGDMNWLGGRPH